jgi:hypothetical protein
MKKTILTLTALVGLTITSQASVYDNQEDARQFIAGLHQRTSRDVIVSANSLFVEKTIHGRVYSLAKAFVTNKLTGEETVICYVSDAEANWTSFLPEDQYRQFLATGDRALLHQPDLDPVKLGGTEVQQLQQPESAPSIHFQPPAIRSRNNWQGRLVSGVTDIYEKMGVDSKTGKPLSAEQKEAIRQRIARDTVTKQQAEARQDEESDVRLVTWINGLTANDPGYVAADYQLGYQWGHFQFHGMTSTSGGRPGPVNQQTMNAFRNLSLTYIYTRQQPLTSLSSFDKGFVQAVADDWGVAPF